jgi:TonB family protein
VDADGRVRNVCVAKSIPELDAAAEKAAKGFVFEPPRRDGEAVPMLVRIEIQFNRRQ